MPTLPRLTTTERRGFTLVELLLVVLLIAASTAVVVPRFRISPTSVVRGAAHQLAQDLEVVRNRAIASRRFARMQFEVAGRRYHGFLDVDGDSAFAQSTAETDSLRFFRSRTLPDQVRFGRGSAAALPGDASADAVTLPSNRLDLSSRGLAVPFGAEGVVYVQHAEQPDVVAAVRVVPSGIFEVWVWRGDRWE